MEDFLCNHNHNAVSAMQQQMQQQQQQMQRQQQHMGQQQNVGHSEGDNDNHARGGHTGGAAHSDGTLVDSVTVTGGLLQHGHSAGAATGQTGASRSEGCSSVPTACIHSGLKRDETGVCQHTGTSRNSDGEMDACRHTLSHDTCVGASSHDRETHALNDAGEHSHAGGGRHTEANSMHTGREVDRHDTDGIRAAHSRAYCDDKASSSADMSIDVDRSGSGTECIGAAAAANSHAYSDDNHAGGSHHGSNLSATCPSSHNGAISGHNGNGQNRNGQNGNSQNGSGDHSEGQQNLVSNGRNQCASTEKDGQNESESESNGVTSEHVTMCHGHDYGSAHCGAQRKKAFSSVLAFAMSVNLSSEQFMEAVEKEREPDMLQVRGRVRICMYVCMHVCMYV